MTIDSSLKVVQETSLGIAQNSSEVSVSNLSLLLPTLSCTRAKSQEIEEFSLQSIGFSKQCCSFHAWFAIDIVACIIISILFLFLIFKSYP